MKLVFGWSFFVRSGMERLTVSFELLAFFVKFFVEGEIDRLLYHSKALLNLNNFFKGKIERLLFV